MAKASPLSGAPTGELPPVESKKAELTPEQRMARLESACLLVARGLQSVKAVNSAATDAAAKNGKAAEMILSG